MDPVRFGRQVRVLRRRRSWRQIDLAGRAQLSRTTISRVELGHVEEGTVRAVQAISTAMSARLDLAPSWNGEALDRLLDAAHAELVEIVARQLRALDWDVAVEVSFNIRWMARGVGRLLVIREARTARRRVATHAQMLSAAFPARNVEVRRYLEAPDPSRPFAGLWFLASGGQPVARHRVAAQRVRAK